MKPSNLDKWRFSVYSALFSFIVVNPSTTKLLKLDKIDTSTRILIQFILIVLISRLSMELNI